MKAPNGAALLRVAVSSRRPLWVRRPVLVGGTLPRRSFCSVARFAPPAAPSPDDATLAAMRRSLQPTQRLRIVSCSSLSLFTRRSCDVAFIPAISEATLSTPTTPALLQPPLTFFPPIPLATHRAVTQQRTQDDISLFGCQADIACVHAAILRFSCASSVPIRRARRRFRGGLSHRIWRCPTLEGPCGPTTIGAGGLNCRVRDGNGWNPTAIGARNLIPVRPRAGALAMRIGKLHKEELSVPNKQRCVVIVSGRLVPVSSTPCDASTPGLSTW